MSEHQTASNKRFVLGAVLVSALLMILLVAGVYLYVQQRPMLTADAALDAAFAGDYERMQGQLDTLNGLDQPQLYYETILNCAKMADYNGRQDLALELLEQPDADDGDAYAAFAETAEEQAAIYTYHQAMNLYEAGEYARAARVAAQVRQYEPALSLYDLAQAAYQATLPTPAPTPVPTPTPTPQPTPEAMPAAVETTEIPQPTATPVPAPEPVVLLPDGRLAAGFEHTVVLMDDGTVRAYGDNTYGQLNVESWQNVTYVAAGAYHTLGLTADGRVLACGDNTHLQTDVSFFSGVKAIAAGDYASFLLLEGGQVMATGYQEYAFLNELTGAEAIWAGSYGLLVKTADGLVSSHPGITLPGNVQRAAVSRGYAIGADANGTTFSTTALIPQWTDAARLTAGENAVLALTEDGVVLSHVFDRHSLCSFDFEKPVLAAAAGPNHYAFILADGTLEIRHSNGDVQQHSLN